MDTTKNAITNHNESVLLKNIEKISQNVTPEDVQAFADVINKEIGDRQLVNEEIEHLQAIMNIDSIEAKNWKNVADVLKYLSIFAIAENNPDGTKKIIECLLGVIGFFYPVANIAGNFLTNVPDKLFPALIKIGGLATPEYWLYCGASIIASHKIEKAQAQAVFDTATDANMASLIIVCKNKLLSTEMNKLIQAEDDIDEETIVGTKDGTVQPIIWNEVAWKAYRDRLSQNDKVLIIGKIKNTEPITAEQTRFEQFGVKYGWNNNIAVIEAEPSVLSKTKNYKEFLSVINTLQIPSKLKKNAKFEFDWIAAGKLAIFPPLLIGDILREGTAVREQQLLYGLYNFYMQDLAAFLNQ